MIRIRKKIRIRIQEAKKHINPRDPDPNLDPIPQQCFYLSMVSLQNFLSCFNSAETTEYIWTRGPEVMKLENKKTERHWVWKIRGPAVTTTTTKIHFKKLTEEPQDKKR
jgi:hypothetical protein